MTDTVIQTRNLTKVYGKGDTATRALDDLTLSVHQGEIFGYLGPNGAGKTTTIRLLLDLIRPTAGSATIFGDDVNEKSVDLHHRIGFMPGELSLWDDRTAKQTLYYIASVRGDIKTQLKEAERLAERLKFDMSKKVRDYSTGNKRKLGLIIALMHEPDLLILDEPTSGLDPLMQQTFNEMMRDIKKEGRTVFLSSHVLSEVQAICDRVAILREGRLEAVENVSELTRVEFRYYELTFRDAVPQQWLQQLDEKAQVDDIHAHENTLRFRLYGDFDPVMRVISDGYLQDVRVDDPSLEEIFLTFYGGEATSSRQHTEQRTPEAMETV